MDAGDFFDFQKRKVNIYMVHVCVCFMSNKQKSCSHFLLHRALKAHSFIGLAPFSFLGTRKGREGVFITNQPERAFNVSAKLQADGFVFAAKKMVTMDLWLSAV